MKIAHLFIIVVLLYSNVVAQQAAKQFASEIKVGAENLNEYLPMLRGIQVALIVNQTSVVGKGNNERHLVDTLKSLGINIVKIFSPEHGLRGTADAGEEVSNGKDAKTGINVISLYGNNKKPTPDNLKGVDIVVFDIQDAGARFFTYISTMHYAMEACAEQKIPFVVLDRPNPNGFYVDGPVLEEKYKSFVGMDPVPIVHGMTVGEYAEMLNGEGWLAGGIKCELTVIACRDYNHKMFYEPPHKPSPNLPNIKAILLYPTLCLFEGTVVSVGRGTDFPFQVYGHPHMSTVDFSFIPQSREGAKDPLYKGITCYGWDYSNYPPEILFEKRQIQIKMIIDAYKNLHAKKDSFFTPYFTKLAGTDQLQKQIEQGLTESEIRQTWQPALEKFKRIRKKYLLYEDFKE